MGKMSAYLDVLNALHSKGVLDLDAAEQYWVEKVKEYFSSEPFNFKLDPSKSLRFCIRHLLKQAEDRQRSSSGTMYHGLVMQHLVGAKIDLLLEGKEKVDHHGAFVADAPRDRVGDFLIGDAAIHVTTAPSEALMTKANKNLEQGLRPIIVTTEDGVGGAKALARTAQIEDRIDVIEIEQFLAANLYEWSAFKNTARPSSVTGLLERYNSIVDQHETDPSLRIEFAQ